MQVKWLRTALSNLEHEANYIASENPAAVRKLVKTLFESVNLLAEQPHLGRAGRVSGTREWLVPGTHYVIPYRVKNNQVEILRVFHQSRKMPNQW